jgi:hypothetical protein
VYAPIAVLLSPSPSPLSEKVPNEVFLLPLFSNCEYGPMAVFIVPYSEFDNVSKASFPNNKFNKILLF